MNERRKNKVLILLLLLLFIGSIGLYVSGFSLKNFLFGLSSQSGEKVGLVKAVTGQLKRQPRDSLEFISAKAEDDLYNEDTIMTGREDGATIALADGVTFEMDPDSLVRLSFEMIQGLGGIERRVIIDVLAGNIRGDLDRPNLLIRRSGQPIARPTEAPSPGPSLEPVAVVEPTRFLQPKPGQVLRVSAGGSPPVKYSILFASPSHPTLETMVVVRDADGKEILRQAVVAKEGRGGVLAIFERPGKYSVEVLNADGSPLEGGLNRSFRVEPEFVRIETEPPLVGGEAITSSEFMGKRRKDFNLILRWKPLPGFEKYKVVVQNQAGVKSLEEVVSGTRLTFPKGKIPTDALIYQVRVDLPNGYVATSKQENFLFNFVSPKQAFPKDGAVISVGDPDVVRQKGILFSWQRTSFTQAYEFELAYDREFANVMRRVTIQQKDNFLIFRNLKPLPYWWRVRAVAGDLKSPPLPGFKMTVTP